MLNEQIKNDLKIAMKSGDKAKIQVLRMLLSAINYGETAIPKYPAEDAVKRYGKKLQEAVQVFTEVLDEARLNEAKAELAIVEVYLPKKPSQEDTEAFVATLDVSKPFGELMKEVKAWNAAADMKLAGQNIKTRQGAIA